MTQQRASSTKSALTLPFRPSNVVFKRTDVADWKQLDELFSFTKSTFKTIDLMCNGAGIYEPVLRHFKLEPGDLSDEGDSNGPISGPTRRPRATRQSTSTSRA